MSHCGRQVTTAPLVQVIKEHGELLQAITEHRADDAAVIATEHMTQAREIRLQLYAGALGDPH